MALYMAREVQPNDPSLCERICADDYMKYAIQECYESFMHILHLLVVGKQEKGYRIIYHSFMLSNICTRYPV